MNAEALLTAAGQNLKRLLAYGGGRPRRLAQEAVLPLAIPAPCGFLRASRCLAGLMRLILQHPDFSPEVRCIKARRRAQAMRRAGASYPPLWKSPWPVGVVTEHAGGKDSEFLQGSTLVDYP